MKKQKIKNLLAAMLMIIIVGISVIGITNTALAETQSIASTQSIATTYDQTKWIPSLGNGHEVVDVYARYSEDYNSYVYGTNIFSKRNIYYTVTLTNNSSDIETDLYMFPNTTHYNTYGTLLGTYSFNTPEAAIYPSGVDAFGNNANYSSVSYSSTTGNYGKVGFMVNVNGAVPWSDTMTLYFNTASRRNVEENIKDESELYTSLGNIEGKRIKADLNINNSENIQDSIKEEDIDLLASEIELYGYTSEKAYELADNYLNTRLTSYNEAINQGYEASDDQVYNAINTLTGKIKEVDNYSEYLAFIDGTGMTEDEYWSTQFNTYKLNETINNYTNAVSNNQ